jgi:hypothetical protein
MWAIDYWQLASTLAGTLLIAIDRFWNGVVDFGGAICRPFGHD